jgi:hypothetical protein
VILVWPSPGKEVGGLIRMMIPGVAALAARSPERRADRSEDELKLDLSIRRDVRARPSPTACAGVLNYGK